MIWTSTSSTISSTTTGNSARSIAAAGYPGPLSYSGAPDALYRNNGDGTFTDVTKEAGVLDADGRGMSATVADLDNDGLLDIYVANDAMENFYYRNLGNGRFENEAVIRGTGVWRRWSGRLVDGSDGRRHRP